MSKKLNKTIITALGVVLFMSAGILAMIFKPSDKIQNSEIISQIQIQEPEIKEVKISEWFIDVAGEVKNPGVYKVSPDSRVFQAIEAAGGFTQKADRKSINLAEKLIDGVQIYVPPKNNPVKNSPSTTKNQITYIQAKIPGVPQNQNYVQNSNGLIDVNNASANELEQLKGVGAVIAKRIVDYRNSNGKFTRPEDLMKVKGIGAKTFEKMRSQILIR